MRAASVRAISVSYVKNGAFAEHRGSTRALALNIPRALTRELSQPSNQVQSSVSRDGDTHRLLDCTTQLLFDILKTPHRYKPTTPAAFSRCAPAVT